MEGLNFLLHALGWVLLGGLCLAGLVFLVTVVLIWLGVRRLGE